MSKPTKEILKGNRCKKMKIDRGRKWDRERVREREKERE